MGSSKSNKWHLYSASSCTIWHASMHGLMEQLGAVVLTQEYHKLGSKPLDKGPPGQKPQLLGHARLLNLRSPQSSYEGVLPNTRGGTAVAKAGNAAKQEAAVPEAASPGDPVEAPRAASLFRDAMGAMQAQGTNGTFEVWHLLVD